MDVVLANLYQSITILPHAVYEPNLQELCRDVIVNILKDEEEIEVLPLPKRLKDNLRESF